MMLGKKVKDTITGFAGIVTGHCAYLTGCNQSLVQPSIKGDGDFAESRWFDDERLDVIADAEKTLIGRFAHAFGPDKAAPRK